MQSEARIKEKLAYICKQFRLTGDLILYRLIPNGHINTAYYVALYDGKEVRQFLVQKVNWYVFRDPVSMMHNIDLITRHIMSKERTLDRQLQDFDARELVESIPHFHDTVFRMNTFFGIVAEDKLGRAKNAQREIETIRRNRDFAGTLCRQIDAGELPIRVTHNDTKTNNILFDRDTLDPLVIIDLDTCMPGLACYDFGDTIRFAACTAEEDEKDESRMKLDLGLFRAYAEGYLSQMGDILSPAERKSLATGAAVITLELASRFLGDYLVGDRYFRIDYPEHNLVRARAQLALFRDMMLHMDDMQAIIDDC